MATANRKPTNKEIIDYIKKEYSASDARILDEGRIQFVRSIENDWLDAETTIDHYIIGTDGRVTKK